MVDRQGGEPCAFWPYTALTLTRHWGTLTHTEKFSVYNEYEKVKLFVEISVIFLIEMDDFGFFFILSISFTRLPHAKYTESFVLGVTVEKNSKNESKFDRKCQNSPTLH